MQSLSRYVPDNHYIIVLPKTVVRSMIYEYFDLVVFPNMAVYKLCGKQVQLTSKPSKNSKGVSSSRDSGESSVSSSKSWSDAMSNMEEPFNEEVSTDT